MNHSPLRIGVIGASYIGGWAATAHLPALLTLAQYELVAVATTRRDSAREAARRYGAAHAFTDPGRLARHPDVEAVAVVVKVPHHVELVSTALEAGKHVFCEWPLTATSAQALQLTSSAASAGVHAAVGFQGRWAPAVVRARALLADGRIGRPVSVTAYAARSVAAGARLPRTLGYTVDAANGAGALEVAGGHTLDTLQFLLDSEMTSVSAQLATQHRQITLDDGNTLTATSPDHLALHASFANQAICVAHVHDAKSSGGRTWIEVSGTEGELVLESAGDDADRGLQIGALTLRVTREAATPAEAGTPYGHADTGPHAAARYNMAAQYAALADDIRDGGSRTASFADGLAMHQLLDALRLSARTGRRIDRLAGPQAPFSSPWPTTR
ncbi:Gfo/Idh/MocA family protein [Streptomyces mirabilis]|uniref:Gfo/Idh/MocA family protein n=1 Tax=Streptomyces mirabilis TaxID=68239 RepID=UPI00225C107F|nr:Gfo/Idh/MocA family oxidoreductase [Streptomyces mirabilis]MCX4617725.1 Gfo/Idh/MocA family oxidoreductase [Streptomyces mirabilis]